MILQIRCEGMRHSEILQNFYFNRSHSTIHENAENHKLNEILHSEGTP